MPRHRPTTLVRTAVTALLTGALLAGVLLAGALPPQPATAAQRLYTPPATAAAQAGAADKNLRVLTRQPHSVWYTTHLSPNQVRNEVRAHTRAAKKAGRVAVLTLYAIPGRDCGGHSAGGFSAKQYRSWVLQAAKGLKGTRPIVILEPDAVAQLDACPGQGNRAGLLSFAAKRLTKAGARVYLDGGHSAWHSPQAMAALLKRSGVKHARGFATNVANFQWTGPERAYGNAVSKELRKLGLRGKRFVIDTSRNGQGPTGETCNPRGRGLGPKPRLMSKGALDGYLWIKVPGESDGYCNGGPGAGEWWPEIAQELVRNRVR